MRDDKKTFAICISFKQDTRHYLIDKDENNKFGIQDGPKFDCIMMVRNLCIPRKLTSCSVTSVLCFNISLSLSGTVKFTSFSNVTAASSCNITL